MPAPALWIHAFVDLPPSLFDVGLGFWTAVTGWPAGRPWPDHPEFRSIEPPDGDAYLHVQRIEGPPRVHLDLVLAAGVSVDDERARHYRVDPLDLEHGLRDPEPDPPPPRPVDPEDDPPPF